MEFSGNHFKTNQHVETLTLIVNDMFTKALYWMMKMEYNSPRCALSFIETSNIKPYGGFIMITFCDIADNI